MPLSREYDRGYNAGRLDAEVRYIDPIERQEKIKKDKEWLRKDFQFETPTAISQKAEFFRGEEF